jgi:hypothetical protein
LGSFRATEMASPGLICRLQGATSLWTVYPGFAIRNGGCVIPCNHMNGPVLPCSRAPRAPSIRSDGQFLPINWPTNVESFGLMFGLAHRQMGPTNKKSTHTGETYETPFPLPVAGCVSQNGNSAPELHGISTQHPFTRHGGGRRNVRFLFHCSANPDGPSQHRWRHLRRL